MSNAFTDNPVEPDRSYGAAGDFTGKQFRAVELDGTQGRVDICDGATDRVVGIVQNIPTAAGRAAAVRQNGVSFVEAGAAVSVGDAVGTDSVGRGVAKSSAGDFYFGFAEEAAAAAGDVIRVRLVHGVLHA